MTKDAAICGVIWDFDGTLYPMDDNHHHSARIAVIKALRDLTGSSTSDLTDSDIIALAEQSYKKYHLSFAFFTHIYGIPADVAHQTYQAYLDIESCIPLPNCKSLQNALNIHRISQCIFTHGTHDWGRRGTKRLSLDTIFSTDLIFGLETVGYHKKDESVNGYMRCVNALGCINMHHIAVIEDTARNLLIPAAHGATTILIESETDRREKPDYVDYIVPNAVAACQLLQSL